MPQRIEYEGEIHEFPDDFTDADIAAALGGDDPSTDPRQATPLPSQSTMGMIAPSTMDGDPRGTGTVFGRSMRPDVQAALGQGEYMAEPIGPNVFGALKAAPGIIARGGVKDLAARAIGRSSIRAGQNMQAAAATAASTPVTELTNVMQAAGRAKELQATGSRMPRVVQQLMTRVQSDAPLSFREAQDFVSSMSRMSANEFNAITPQMQRQVVEMSKALRGGLVAAAGKAGGPATAEQYTAGVREYAKSAQAAKRWEAMKPALWATLRRLGYAGAAGAGYKGLTSEPTR